MKLKKPMKATTVLRMNNLSEPSLAVHSVATYVGKDHYKHALKRFFSEIRTLAAELELVVYDQELETAEEEGYIEIGDNHFYLLNS